MAIHNEAYLVDGMGCWGCTDLDDDTVFREEWKVSVDVVVGSDGVDDDVTFSSMGLYGFRILRGDEVGGAFIFG